MGERGYVSKKTHFFFVLIDLITSSRMSSIVSKSLISSQSWIAWKSLIPSKPWIASRSLIALKLFVPTCCIWQPHAVPTHPFVLLQEYSFHPSCAWHSSVWKQLEHNFVAAYLTFFLTRKKNRRQRSFFSLFFFLPAFFFRKKKRPGFQKPKKGPPLFCHFKHFFLKKRGIET